MKILVTGGLGYIGSHTVVELINNGHEVVILDNLSNSNVDVHDALESLTGKTIPFCVADILDEEALNQIFLDAGNADLDRSEGKDAKKSTSAKSDETTTGRTSAKNDESLSGRTSANNDDTATGKTSGDVDSGDNRYQNADGTSFVTNQKGDPNAEMNSLVHPIEGIIHFAAKKSVPESLARPVTYFENNIKGVIHLMRAVSRFGIPHVVFSSSCTVYGEPEVVPVTESTPTTRSITPYGNSKLISEMMLDEFTRLTPHVSTAILRYFNPVGAHESAKIGELPIGVPGNLMPFITQTAAGWRDKLNVFGSDYETRDGTAIRDYIHVVDLAEAHVKSIEWLANQQNVVDFFNLGTGNGHTVMEVIESFERTTGVKLNYEMAPRREGDIEQIWAVTDKAERILGWKAKLKLDDMTSSAWKWQQTVRK